MPSSRCKRATDPLVDFGCMALIELASSANCSYSRELTSPPALAPQIVQTINALDHVHAREGQGNRLPPHQTRTGGPGLMSGNKGLLMKGVAWIALARILVNLLAFASMIILARILAPEDFGLVAIATSVAAVISSVTELSLSQALVHHDEPKEPHFHTAWTLNLSRSVLMALVIAAAATPAAAAYGDTRLATILLVLAGATVIGGLENPKLVTFERQLIFSQQFWLRVTEKVVAFIFAIGVAFAFQTYWALIVGSIAAQISRLLLSYILIPYRPRASLAAYRELLSFSIWLTLGKAAQAINTRSDPLIIGFFVNSTILGYYSMSSRLARMPVQEGLGPMRQVLFPAFARMKHDLPRMRAAYLRTQALLCTLAFPISAGFAALAEPAIRLLLGDKWLPTVPIVQVITIVVALGALNGVQQLALATGRTKSLFGLDLRSLCIRMPCVIGGLLIGREIGIGAIMGAVYGLAVANVFNLVWNMQLTAQIIDLQLVRQFAVAQRPAIASVLLFLAVAMLHRLLPVEAADLEGFATLGGLVCAGIVTYGAALGLLWLAQGRPSGAESEVLNLLKQMTSKALRRGDGSSRA